MRRTLTALGVLVGSVLSVPALHPSLARAGLANIETPFAHPTGAVLLDSRTGDTSEEDTSKEEGSCSREIEGAAGAPIIWKQVGGDGCKSSPATEVILGLAKVQDALYDRLATNTFTGERDLAKCQEVAKRLEEDAGDVLRQKEDAQSLFTEQWTKHQDSLRTQDYVGTKTEDYTQTGKTEDYTQSSSYEKPTELAAADLSYLRALDAVAMDARDVVGPALRHFASPDYANQCIPAGTGGLTAATRGGEAEASPECAVLQTMRQFIQLADAHESAVANAEAASQRCSKMEKEDQQEVKVVQETLTGLRDANKAFGNVHNLMAQGNWIDLDPTEPPEPEEPPPQASPPPMTPGDINWPRSIQGRIVSGPSSLGVGELPVTVGGFGTVTTTENGFFTLILGSGVIMNEGVTIKIQVTLNALVGTAFRDRVKVMDDIFNARTDEKSVSCAGKITAGGGANLGTIKLGNDVDIWRIMRLVVLDYHAVVKKRFPGNEHRAMRRAAVWGTTPYTFYGYIDFATNWQNDWGQTDYDRMRLIFHESGHAIRHKLDGGEAHWHWDDFRIIYARSHDGHQIANDAYTFNEGWAGYWSSRKMNTSKIIKYNIYDPPTESAWMDWVENMAANRLLNLSKCFGDEKMVLTLESAPEGIHSLYRFEKLLYQNYGAMVSCNSLQRGQPNACPPDYANDGYTCRLRNIKWKDVRGRGAGFIWHFGDPLDDSGMFARCHAVHGSGNCERYGLIVYPKCQKLFDPSYSYFGCCLCRQEKCPKFFTDHGATCYRDPHIFTRYPGTP